MTPENWLTLVTSISTLVITLASLYFKHRLDMAEYLRTNKRVTKVQETIDRTNEAEKERER